MLVFEWARGMGKYFYTTKKELKSKALKNVFTSVHVSYYTWERMVQAKRRVYGYDEIQQQEKESRRAFI
jgi:hypothetical protein